MTQIDQFESAFRAASRTRFRYQPVALKRVLAICDLAAEAVGPTTLPWRTFLGGLADAEALDWETVAGDAYRSVGDLLEIVGRSAPDLICTYRNLQTNAWHWPHTLGDHLEVLTQVSAVPILVLPRPEAPPLGLDAGTANVMAITDHLTGDDRLVNYAARFTARGGRLLLTHVEDEATFERYLDIISKLPDFDTDYARVAIRARLLKEPTDYITSCRQGLADQAVPLQLEQVVTLGHRLHEFRQLVEHHQIQLLVLNTKDEDQLAMHGLAYPLAVELRRLPLLML